ncbi:MAG: ATP-dependent DNA helicase RecG [bacterium]
MPSLLESKITSLRKIDKRRQSALLKLGIETVADLLNHFPVRYNDFSQTTPIKELKVDELATIKGEILTISSSRSPRKRLLITEALIKDDSGTIKAVWFNQRFIETSLKKGYKVNLAGKVERSYLGLQISSPEFERVKSDQVHTGRIIPVYSLSGALTSKWLRFILKPLLPKALSEIEDYLPAEIKKRNSLIDLEVALQQIHYPDSNNSLKEARARLAFDELFLIQLYNLSAKNKWQQHQANSLKFDDKLMKNFVSSLPFTLTNAQKKTAWEILQDLEKSEPMNRLLEGDVGSGKTIVALMAVLQTVKNGYQAVLLAPTEILACQHFNSAQEFLPDLKIGLLTRSQKEINDVEVSDQEIKKQLKKGAVEFLITTHAVLQKDIKFKDLALAIIDEQHRFGVEQRASLKDKTPKKMPHLLSMTATPIPRTLALALYSDLNLSIISEMPKDRKKILTKIVQPQNRGKAYDFIEQQIQKGRQVFVICPLIEESDKLGVKSVTAEYEKLSKQVFPQLKIDFLHGRLKKDEKQQKMEEFLKNKINVLVSTSVIEVGVDVPNATVMMIEGADRFGLAQLHQFRGRVGRSEHQSFCFLFTDSASDKTLERLNALQKSNNGFELAEMDLELRGPGEVFGIRQSGLPDLKTATLSDHKLIAITKKEAEKLIAEDAKISKYPLLKAKIKAFTHIIHPE